MKDYFGYKDKVCVITGASSGMGKATAQMLVDLGAKVYCLNRSEVKVEGITAFIPTDLSSKESIDSAFTQIPEKIDSFFGIAGASGVSTDFMTTVKIDFISNKYISECILPSRMGEGGSIAYMTSTAGANWNDDGNKMHIEPILDCTGWDEVVAKIESTPLPKLPGNIGYSFSKLAMNYMVAKQQSMFAPKRIRVNAVLPGSTDTGLKADFVKLTGSEERLLQFTGYAKRLATSEEMAYPIVFLNSDMASYISGELLIADYGLTIETQSGIKPNLMNYTVDAHLKRLEESK